jgi:hypothetical protein
MSSRPPLPRQAWSTDVRGHAKDCRYGRKAALCTDVPGQDLPRVGGVPQARGDADGMSGELRSGEPSMAIGPQSRLGSAQWPVAHRITEPIGAGDQLWSELTPEVDEPAVPGSITIVRVDRS